MSKQIWKPGNMLYPVPAVLVSVADSAGNDNLITIAWTGTVCSDPAMTYISVRKERYSHHMLHKKIITKEKDRHPTVFFVPIYNSCLCVYKSTSLNNKA